MREVEIIKILQRNGAKWDICMHAAETELRIPTDHNFLANCHMHRQ